MAAPDLEIEDLRRHSEGFSWETYTLDANWTDAETGVRRETGFAVRVEPRDGLLAPYDTAAQYEIHRLVAEHSDVPMPKLFWLERDTALFGMPFYVMERIRGVVPVQWRGDDPEVFPTPAARREIGLQFVDIQAELHRLDWRTHGRHVFEAPADAAASARRQVEDAVDRYERSRLIEVPILREAITWLRANLVHSDRVVICHGDYRIGNFMVRDGRIVAIFDWELAHLGDPVEDIAYGGLPLFRGRTKMLSQLLEPAEYFERYEQQSGLRVDPDVFRYWTIHGLVKAASSYMRGCRAVEDGRTDDLRLAAMGHQTQYLLRHLARELELREDMT